MLATVGFTFEHTEYVTEALFLERQRALLAKRPRSAAGWLRVVLFLAVAVAMLFSLYTFSVGLVALGLVAFVSTMDRWSDWANRKKYRELRYLRGPQTYGVSETGLWFRSAGLHAESTWANLYVWDERADNLRLAASGMPEIYLPLAGLREAGVHERVMELARSSGKQYDAGASRAADG
jgi:hypothetical protein